MCPVVPLNAKFFGVRRSAQNDIKRYFFSSDGDAGFALEIMPFVTIVRWPELPVTKEPEGPFNWNFGAAGIFTGSIVKLPPINWPAFGRLSDEPKATAV